MATLIERPRDPTFDTPETLKRVKARLAKKHPWGSCWLTHGQTFPIDQKQWHVKEFCLPGRCFQNALTACISASEAYKEKGLATEIRYAEGLMVEKSGIYMHAWCTFDGKVRDFTFPANAHKYLYFGVTFDVDFVWDVVRGRNRKVYPGLTTRWRRNKDRVIPYLERMKQSPCAA